MIYIRLITITIIVTVAPLWAEDLKVVLDALDLIRPNVEKAKSEYGKKIKAENDRLIAILKKSLEIATKAGKFDDAISIKTALDKAQSGEYLAMMITPPIDDLLSDNPPISRINEKTIKLPMGGSVAVSDGKITLTGPGIGDVRNAAAILPMQIGVGKTVSGDIITGGKWCGFALASNLDGTVFVSLYGEGNGTSSIFRHSGLTRVVDVIGTNQIVIPAAGTAKYSISRVTKTNWIITVQDSKYTIVDPRGNDYFGIMSYDGGKVSLTIRDK